MLNGGMTRFDCALGSHAMMRRASRWRFYHAHQRHVFGNPLIQQPLMRHVLSRMALQLEGQTACCFVFATWDRRADAKEALWARLFTPAAKFRLQKRYAVCRRSDGGAGRHWLLRGERGAAALPGDVGKQYLGRFRRVRHVMCLDVLRVLNKQAGVYDLLSEAFVEVKGQESLF